MNEKEDIYVMKTEQKKRKHLSMNEKEDIYVMKMVINFYMKFDKFCHRAE